MQEGWLQSYEDIRDDRTLDTPLALDVLASHNFAEPASGVNRLRAFDSSTDRFDLGYARATLAHRPGHAGFRIDVGFGAVADEYLHSDPAASTNPTLARATSYLGQAFVTAVLPIGRGLVIDVGKFETPVGLEDNESLTNWNYSHSLLYTFAEPTLHTGMRASYAPVSQLALSAFWVNGWNANVVGGNGMSTFALAAAWRPIAKLEMVLVDMAGPERAIHNPANPAQSLRNVVDVYATYSPASFLSLAVTGDYGIDASLGGVQWGGVASYVNLHVRSWLSLAARAELFDDPQGFATGAAGLHGEVTATAQVEHVDGRQRLMARVEYRHDASTVNVFDGVATASRSTQDTITLALALGL